MPRLRREFSGAGKGLLCIALMHCLPGVLDRRHPRLHAHRVKQVSGLCAKGVSRELGGEGGLIEFIELRFFHGIGALHFTVEHPALSRLDVFHSRSSSAYAFYQSCRPGWAGCRMRPLALSKIFPFPQVAPWKADVFVQCPQPEIDRIFVLNLLPLYPRW